MNTLDLTVNAVYTDGYIRYRKITGFFDDFDGKRMVKYEKGMLIPNGNFRKFYTGQDHSCSKKTFAKWAIKKVRQEAEA